MALSRAQRACLLVRMDAFDILLVPRVDRGDPAAIHGLSVLANPLPIGFDVEARQVSEDLSNAIWRACSAPGLWPADHYMNEHMPVAYGFVTKSSTDLNLATQPYSGKVGPLQRVFSLSRLIRPHAMGMRLAAHVTLDESGSPHRIAPIFRGTSIVSEGLVPEGFENEHGWLDVGELRSLKGICEAIASGGGWEQVPHRVRRAAVSHENAVHADDPRVRVVLMATGWECLTTVARHGVSHQFRERGAGIAAAFGRSTYTVSIARDAYSARSGFAHGKRVPTFEGQTFTSSGDALAHASKVSAEMERALRSVLCGILRDPSTWPAFATDPVLEATYAI